MYKDDDGEEKIFLLPFAVPVHFGLREIHCILRAELLVTRYLQGAAVCPDVQLNRAEWWPSVVIEVHLLITLTLHVTLTLLL